MIHRECSILLLLLLSISYCPRSDAVINHKFLELRRGIDGGLGCATCTVLISLIDQLAEVNNQTIIESFDTFCLKLPADFSKPCQVFAEAVGPILIEMIAEEANSDDICRGIGLCYQQKGQKMCALYKKTVKFDEKRIYHYQRKTQKHLLHNWKIDLRGKNWNICDFPGFHLVCYIFEKTFERHLPTEDLDGDYHSTEDTLRGASWRGKDCNDDRADIYPGRRPELLNDVDYDSNCNGIYGFDNKTGKSYEELYCQGTGQMGVAVLGDSVGAHFHAPEEWFDPTKLTKKSLSSLPFALGNELDWPQLSLVTGYMDSIWDVAKGPTVSVYKNLLRRNRCNHRDYQNVAVNGDDSFDIQNYTYTLKRDKHIDYPLFLVLELVGNDVCNNLPEDQTVAGMTTEAQMAYNLKSLFQKLNKTVPAKSKVLIVGMADGDYLYKFLANRTHPFGRWRNDLKYSDVYEWWNCMRVTPCIGWLNNNATIRALTTDRANNLSKVMESFAIKNKHTWSNMEINFVKCPITEVIRQYLVEHGPDSGYQLIEPVDGFHPNQLGQALSAKAVWRHMELNLSHYLGPINPHNAAINKTFGDQGGY